MEFPSLVLLCVAVALAVIAWAVLRIVRRRRIDAQFGATVSGGRGGHIKILCGGRPARAEYEVGTTVDFLVYESSLAWASGDPLTASDKQFLADTLKAWSAARGSKLEIANDTQRDFKGS
ncbi:hypothetical protein [Solimonas sp. K1W22B-7]|uniref:hypothetical protein n=1 Tax=Solimonas sp. K1W22B-7 TaxID=2303331 RepID=UPI0013C49B5F|nr:hypothetical protein [Solimonas sp. K1W22B-7]